ncbi:LysE family translocator [Aestuariibaculum suncheonense]|uniref:LysE family translocator n=1 Tax=Aestuariibaculum suncheonense TaxID=1028745 RepID=A0A8J6QSL1_9FLAO|nr:LysE family translocator [Aestuariibaculum suncheonense]MBD0835149.1 LysE family translocator [Aestuariibaculum suncheonense]
MFGIENFMTFALTALLFVMAPGMDTVFVLNKSIGEGRKSGMYAVLGINTGVLTHTFLGAIGLSVLIAKSELAFALIKYVGALYVIYMGVLKLKSKTSFLSDNQSEQPSKIARSDFWSGFFTNSLNPKVALFFLAFFPQFINRSEIENPIPFIVLGLTFALIGVIWYLSLTLFASSLSHKVKSHPQSSIWLNRLSGLIFVCMGLKMALG